MDPGVARRTLDALGLACAGALALALGVAAAQPIFTDDLWWHLSLGRAFAEGGLQLAADPQLFAAAGPPSTSAWLFERACFAVAEVAGLQGLRVLHVLHVAAVLGLAWRCLRRASGSIVLGSLLSMAFVGLSAYRLVQLRPHLLTMLATLLLYRLALEPGGRRRALRLAGVVALLVVWANAHSAFVLGPLLLGAAAVGVGAARFFEEADLRRASRARLGFLALALGLGSLATLANPGGIEPHLAWFAAGEETPSLLRVADEWLPVALFRLPVPRLPPSPLAWGLVWACVACVAFALVPAPVLAGRGRRAAASRPDPALLAVSVLAVALMLTAVRFTWLGIFPLLLLARDLEARGVARCWSAKRAAVAALAALGLLVAFLRAGDWPMISRVVSAELAADWTRFARPYPPSKYFAHAVWLLADAGLRGRLYNDYTLGGFMGYWLAPEIQVFVNGSLNVPPEVMTANRAIRLHRGRSDDEDLLELLDAYGIDLFFGIRLPIARPGSKAFFFTTPDLEGAPGWIPVFRNLDSALYLRDAERNRENLERLAAWYAKEGVPFDPAVGFDPARVIRRAPAWAVHHGMIPVDFAALATASRTGPVAQRLAARERLASLYVALGLYDDALRLDARTLQRDPGNPGALRRTVWSLLRAGRLEEARAAAVALPDDARHPLAAGLKRALREIDASTAPGEAAALRARIPLFSEAEAAWLKSGVLPAEARAR